MDCKIGVISGDGIGPEIVAEAKKVLNRIGDKYGHKFTYTDILMGGRSAEELFWTKLYESLSKNIYLTTDDGSVGTKGTVMALLPQLLKEGGYDCVYVCGPVPMMRAVANACLEAGVKCQVSLEKYMACGLGACLSCACEGIGKRIKVCKDGPVFLAEEVGEW